jgi:uncharacterized membrane protein
VEDRRKLGCVGLCVFVLALLFCLMGLVQAAWLSATPGFPAERTQRNVLIWGSGSLFSLVMLCVFAVIYYRARGKRD